MKRDGVWVAREQLYQLTGVYTVHNTRQQISIHIIHTLVHVLSMPGMDGNNKIGHRTTIRKTQYNTFASHFTVICLCFAGISLSITMVTSSPTKQHFLLGCYMVLFMYFVYTCSCAHTHSQYIEYKFSDSGKEIYWSELAPVQASKTTKNKTKCIHNTTHNKSSNVCTHTERNENMPNAHTHAEWGKC